MTHTDPTAAALLRAILLHPADDTARLVFADWLDEHGEHERAEFVRVQVFGRGLLGTAQACPHCVDGARLGDVGTGAPPRCAECCGTGSRYAREWGGIPCPACEGSKRVLYGDAETGASLELGCTDCASTGLAPVEFRRGFPDRVRCRMGDVLRWSNSEAWTLTPWARAALAAHPVTAWEIAGAEPWANYAGTHWGWWSENSHTVADASTLPHVVMAALADDSRRCDINISLRYTAAKAVPNGCVLFATEAEARDALALAVGRVARRLAGLPEVTP